MKNIELFLTYQKSFFFECPMKEKTIILATSFLSASVSVAPCFYLQRVYKLKDIKILDMNLYKFYFACASIIYGVFSTIYGRHLYNKKNTQEIPKKTNELIEKTDRGIEKMTTLIQEIQEDRKEVRDLLEKIKEIQKNLTKKHGECQ